MKISTHTPHAGRNPEPVKIPVEPEIDFNSHAPCGAQHYFPLDVDFFRDRISTHTPHAGRNDDTQDEGWKKIISTHTPHAGRNFKSYEIKNIHELNFNSHAPCGAQLDWLQLRRLNLFKFQLTRPMRGAT